MFVLPSAKAFNFSSVGTLANGLNKVEAEKISLYTANLPRLTVDANGNVGIGTTTPQTKLHIIGGLTITEEFTVGDMIVNNNLLVRGTTTTIDSTTVSVDDSMIRLADNNAPGDLVDIGFYGMYIDSGVTKFGGMFRDASENKWHIFDNDLNEPGLTTHTVENPYFTLDSDSGYVGIGLTAPAYPLDVDGAAQVGNDLIVQGNIFIKGTTTDGLSDFGNIWASSGTSDNVYLTAVANGQVAIGVTAATNTLTVHGDIGVSGPIVPLLNEEFDLGATGARFRDLYLSGNTIHLGDATITTTEDGTSIAFPDIESLASDTNLTFSTAGVERMRIESGGDVGIGTNTPSGLGQLHLHTASSSSSNIQFTNNTTGAASGNGMYVGIDVAEGGVMWQQESNYLRFGTNNTERMRIDTSGNVGIGTNNPLAKLQVDGQFNIIANSDTWNSTVGKGIHMRYSTNGVQDQAYIQSIDRSTSTAYPLYFTGSEYVFDSGNVNINGNVGIGTDSPQDVLHIHTTNTTNYLRVTSSASTANNNGCWFGVDDNARGIIRNRENTDMAFFNNNLQKMVLDSGGNLGIGTAAPSSLLHTYTSGSNNKFTLESGGATDSPYLSILNTTGNLDIGVAGSNDAFFTGALDGDGCIKSVADKLHLGSSTITPAITINTSNNVGIGTASPTTTLDVYGKIDLNGAGLSATNGAGIYYWSSGDTKWGTYMATSGAGYSFSGGSAVSYGGVSDHAIRMRVNNGSANGFIWETNTEAGRMALVGSTGNLTISGTYSPFTGSHATKNEDIMLGITSYKGLIASSIGRVGELTVDNSVIQVQLANTDNDKRVYGVVSHVCDNGEEDCSVMVNSVGEGAIWVCDVDGEIENGDLITSCEVPGYGRLQDDDLMHNYTVAKATEDSDFFDMDVGVTYHRWVDWEGDEIDETTYDTMIGISASSAYQAKFISCSYHCG